MAVDEDMFNFYDRQNRGFGPLDERPWKPRQENVLPSEEYICLPRDNLRGSSGLAGQAIPLSRAEGSAEGSQMNSSRHRSTAPVSGEKSKPPNHEAPDLQNRSHLTVQTRRRDAILQSWSDDDEHANELVPTNNKDDTLLSHQSKSQLQRPAGSVSGNAKLRTREASSLATPPVSAAHATRERNDPNHKTLHSSNDHVHLNETSASGLDSPISSAEQPEQSSGGNSRRIKRNSNDSGLQHQNRNQRQREVGDKMDKLSRQSGSCCYLPVKRPVKSRDADAPKRKHTRPGWKIPGPAGDLQQTMGEDLQLRRECATSTASLTSNPAHDTNGPNRSDEDFRKGPWMSAIDALDATQALNASWSPSWTTIGFVRKGGRGGRVEQVVGVIKSCVPNELGDLYIELKDPTGTINGTLPAAVLADEAMARDLSAGAVLILKSPVVFSPWPGAQHLNITPNNISHIFPASTEPPPGQARRALPQSNSHVPC